MSRFGGFAAYSGASVHCLSQGSGWGIVADRITTLEVGRASVVSPVVLNERLVSKVFTGPPRFTAVALRRRPINVRFAPNSGHRRLRLACLLCPASGHRGGA